MQIYTYSEARQKLASVLDKAEATGSVIIKRRDGRSFILVPQKSAISPLDVPSVGARISTDELIELVREERGRTRGRSCGANRTKRHVKPPKMR